MEIVIIFTYKKNNMGEFLNMTWEEYQEKINKELSKRSRLLLNKLYEGINTLRLIDGTEDIYPISKNSIQLTFKQILSENEIKELESIAINNIKPFLKKTEKLEIEKVSTINIAIHQISTNLVAKNNDKELNERTQLLFDYFENVETELTSFLENIDIIFQDLVTLEYFKIPTYDEYTNFKIEVEKLINDKINKTTEKLVIEIYSVLSFNIE